MGNESKLDDGGSDEEPNEDSVENARDQLGENDEELLRAGHGGHLLQPGEGQIDEQELRRRIADRVDALMSDELEAPPEDIKQIRDFLTTMRVRGADTISNQEIELLWHNVMRNPGMIRDFTFHLAVRKTRNNYSEFPLLPDARDLLEFADNFINPQSLRPQMIRDAAENLEAFGVDGADATGLMMGVKGDDVAEAMRLLGWIAGFPFMQGAEKKHREHVRQMGLDGMSVHSVAHTSILILDENISILKERAETAYIQIYKMDHAAMQRHEEVLNTLIGIQNLLLATFTRPQAT